MKLIRCEIQNFGKIRKGTYEFKDGKVYKNGKCEEMVFEVKEPCFSVRFI